MEKTANDRALRLLTSCGPFSRVQAMALIPRLTVGELVDLAALDEKINEWADKPPAEQKKLLAAGMGPKPVPPQGAAISDLLAGISDRIRREDMAAAAAAAEPPARELGPDDPTDLDGEPVAAE